MTAWNHLEGINNKKIALSLKDKPHDEAVRNHRTSTRCAEGAACYEESGARRGGIPTFRGQSQTTHVMERIDQSSTHWIYALTYIVL